MIAVELLMMVAFMVGAIVGNEADVRAAEREVVDDEWADEFVSVMHGTAPDLFEAAVA